MKKIIPYCCFVLLLNFSINANAQTINSGLLSIASNTQWAVTGDYNNNNQELAIELGSATENDLLTASCNVALSGTLKVNFANSFVPISSQTFTIISAANIAGTFNNLILPSGYMADINYNANNVVLSNFSSSTIPITGSLTACSIGTASRLYIATSGGVWSSTNTTVATINSSGIVTPISNGITTIRYTYTRNGNTNISSTTFTVAAVPIPNAIAGITSLCVGSSIVLSNSTLGGVWSSLNNRASINSGSGFLSGLNGGTAIINYTVNNAYGCSNSVKCSIVVNANPDVPNIAYAPGLTFNPQAGAPAGSFCVGKVFGVSGTPSGGTWSSTGVASITNGGIVTINSVGTGSIEYTYTNASGCSNSRTMVGNGFVCAARSVNTFDSQLSTVDDFTMYPNPAKTFINLNVETLIGKGNIVITDLYGKTVKKQILSMGTNTIDIANLSKGIYFVSAITSNGKTTKKLVVE